MAILNTNDMLFKAFQPKVQNQFILKIDGQYSWYVKKVSGIGFEDGEIKLDYINSYKKLRGKRSWNDVTLNLYDPISPSAAQETMDWARLGYESLTGRAGYSDFYKKTLTLEVLGPVGDVVSEWIIEGAFIKSYSQGDFDWASPEAIEMTITVGCDNQILNF